MTNGVYKRKPFTSEHRAALSMAHTGVPLSPEHCTAISSAKMGENNPMYGKPHSQGHCAAISAALMRHEVFEETRKKIADAMIGGDDIVWHHTLYDHANLSKNRVPMTRRSHTMGHRVLQKLGIEIQHINVKVVRSW